MKEKIKDLLWYGSGEEKFSFVYENMQGEVKKHTTAFEGIIPMLRRRHREAFSERMRLDIEGKETRLDFRQTYTTITAGKMFAVQLRFTINNIYFHQTISQL